MSTWVGTIVATTVTSEFWKVAAKHGVRQIGEGVPPFALIECEVGLDFRASIRLAEELSRDLATMAIGFVVQTTSDVHEMHTFMNGKCVRRLGYSRDEGGWIDVDGEAQAWERQYFFDENSTAEGGTWPDMLFDELSDDDMMRYEAAKRAGDASQVLSLLNPSSTAPMLRVFDFLGINPELPAGRWKKRSFRRRVFGRG